MDQQVTPMRPEPAAPPASQDADLIWQMKNIAKFYGVSERTAFNQAVHNRLPGCFRIGKLWCLSKSAAREAIAETVRRAAANGSGKPR